MLSNSDWFPDFKQVYHQVKSSDGLYKPTPCNPNAVYNDCNNTEAMCVGKDGTTITRCLQDNRAGICMDRSKTDKTKVCHVYGENNIQLKPTICTPSKPYNAAYNGRDDIVPECNTKTAICSSYRNIFPNEKCEDQFADNDNICVRQKPGDKTGFCEKNLFSGTRQEQIKAAVQRQRQAVNLKQAHMQQFQKRYTYSS